MVTSRRRFHSKGESDWLSNTSAIRFFTESQTAQKILQNLLKDLPSDGMEDRGEKNVIKELEESEDIGQEPHPTPDTGCSTPKEDTQKVEKSKSRKKSGNIFDDFDESQHLNGCPLKWFYNKKLMERNKKYRPRKWSSKTKSAKKEGSAKEKRENVRDKTPTEVKIHKINLIEKYTCSNDDVYLSSLKLYDVNKLDFVDEDLEAKRKKLAAKLHWKLYDDDPEDYDCDTSSEISSRQNYLPPRPLLGLKPLLSILLSPYQYSNCCSIKIQPNTSREPLESASLSIQSLDLPLFTPETKAPSKSKNSPRWGSKILQKKLQVPNQVNLNLRQQEKKFTVKSETTNKVLNALPMKKSGEKIKIGKHSKSLSSLIYELSDKVNYRNDDNESLDELLKGLVMEDEEIKIKRFLHYNYKINNFNVVLKKEHDDKKKVEEVIKSTNDESELNLICGKARFFDKELYRKQKQKYCRPIIRIDSGSAFQESHQNSNADNLKSER